jgi:predicted site-specific integrase-resolvase
MGIMKMIPIDEAAKMRGARIAQIRRLIALGAIQAAEDQNGDILVSTSDLNRLEWLPDIDRLSDVPIHVSEAARRYDLPIGSLSRWADADLIRVIGHEGNKTLLNEADVAFIKMVIDTEA